MKLNSIADILLKDKKIEYPDQANMITFAYTDWIRFVTYNLKDVLLQLGIERKTNDILTYYMRSHSNLTPYNKIFRETHLMRNVREMYFEKEGWVQSNNLNILGDGKSEEERRFYRDDSDEDDSDVTFKGAINANPIWNDNVGQKVLGSRSNNLFANTMDYDMGAYYPSLKISSNLDASTLLYKAAFNNDEFQSGEFRNRSQNQDYEEKDKNGKIRKNDLTGEAVNTFVSGNTLTFGYNWLGLPDVTEMRKLILQQLG